MGNDCNVDIEICSWFYKCYDDMMSYFQYD